jgi:hypothetical protein
MAFRRDTLEKLGGLLEVGILGAGDHHMCGAIIGKGELTYPPTIHENYKKAIQSWESLAQKYIKRDLSYVKGTILHSFHGAKKARQYASRWDILTSTNYDPCTDVWKNMYGVYELVSTRTDVRDGIRKYFVSRNEDSPDMFADGIE